MMTWQPIGPEQMDGRVYAVGWEDDPRAITFGTCREGEWINNATRCVFTFQPTRYLPGVRPLGEAEAPRDARTVRVAVAVWKNGWAAEGRSNLPDCEAREGAILEGQRQGFCGPFEYRVITADLPIPEVREIAASVEAE